MSVRSVGGTSNSCACGTQSVGDEFQALLRDLNSSAKNAASGACQGTDKTEGCGANDKSNQQNDLQALLKQIYELLQKLMGQSQGGGAACAKSSDGKIA